MGYTIHHLLERAMFEVAGHFHGNGWEIPQEIKVSVLNDFIELTNQIDRKTAKLKKTFPNASSEMTHVGVLMERFLARDSMRSDNHFAFLQEKRSAIIRDFFTDFGVSPETTEKIVEYFISL